MIVYPTITVPENLLDRDKLSRFECGSYAVVVNTPEVQKELKVAYGRKNLCVKVLKGQTPAREIKVYNPVSAYGYHSSYSVSTSVQGLKLGDEAYIYGAVPLWEATTIQNLVARKGLAPRVYGWASVNGLVAQVVDYVPRVRDPDPAAREAREQNMLQVFEELEIVSVATTLDLGVNNWRSDKLVDFSHFKFKDYSEYVESLDVRTRTRRGEVLPKAYQPIPALGIEGSRDIAARIENLKLKDLPFKGASVLDIGCNLGTFCRYAMDAGALRVLGIDKIGQLSFEINNVLEYWNLDIVETEIPSYLEEKHKAYPRGFRFDIVFLMAVQNYIGGIEAALHLAYPVIKKMIVIESHGGEAVEVYDQAFAKFKFSKIEYLGYVEDPQRRHQWVCYK